MSVNLLISLLRVKPLLTRKDLAQRYSRDLRTIDRWHASGVLPAPIYLINKRHLPCPFWRPEDILRTERKTPALASQLPVLKQTELPILTPTHEQPAAKANDTAPARNETAETAEASDGHRNLL